MGRTLTLILLALFLLLSCVVSRPYLGGPASSYIAGKTRGLSNAHVHILPGLKPSNKRGKQLIPSHHSNLDAQQVNLNDYANNFVRLHLPPATPRSLFPVTQLDCQDKSEKQLIEENATTTHLLQTPSIKKRKDKRTSFQENPSEHLVASGSKVDIVGVSNTIVERTTYPRDVPDDPSFAVASTRLTSLNSSPFMNSTYTSTDSIKVTTSPFQTQFSSSRDSGKTTKYYPSLKTTLPSEAPELTTFQGHEISELTSKAILLDDTDSHSKAISIDNLKHFTTPTISPATTNDYITTRRTFISNELSSQPDSISISTTTTKDQTTGESEITYSRVNYFTSDDSLTSLHTNNDQIEHQYSFDQSHHPERNTHMPLYRSTESDTTTSFSNESNDTTPTNTVSKDDNIFHFTKSKYSDIMTSDKSSSFQSISNEADNRDDFTEWPKETTTESDTTTSFLNESINTTPTNIVSKDGNIFHFTKSTYSDIMTSDKSSSFQIISNEADNRNDITEWPKETTTSFSEENLSTKVNTVFLSSMPAEHETTKIDQASYQFATSERYLVNSEFDKNGATLTTNILTTNNNSNEFSSSPLSNDIGSEKVQPFKSTAEEQSNGHPLFSTPYKQLSQEETEIYTTMNNNDDKTTWSPTSFAHSSHKNTLSLSLETSEMTTEINQDDIPTKKETSLSQLSYRTGISSTGNMSDSLSTRPSTGEDVTKYHEVTYPFIVYTDNKERNMTIEYENVNKYNIDSSSFPDENIITDKLSENYVTEENTANQEHVSFSTAPSQTIKSVNIISSTDFPTPRSLELQTPNKANFVSESIHETSISNTEDTTFVYNAYNVETTSYNMLSTAGLHEDLVEVSPNSHTVMKLASESGEDLSYNVSKGDVYPTSKQHAETLPTIRPDGFSYTNESSRTTINYLHTSNISYHKPSHSPEIIDLLQTTMNNDIIIKTTTEARHNTPQGTSNLQTSYSTHTHPTKAETSTKGTTPIGPTLYRSFSHTIGPSLEVDTSPETHEAHGPQENQLTSDQTSTPFILTTVRPNNMRTFTIFLPSKQQYFQSLKNHLLKATAKSDQKTKSKCGKWTRFKKFRKNS